MTRNLKRGGTKAWAFKYDKGRPVYECIELGAKPTGRPFGVYEFGRWVRGTFMEDAPKGPCKHQWKPWISDTWNVPRRYCKLCPTVEFKKLSQARATSLITRKAKEGAL